MTDGGGNNNNQGGNPANPSGNEGSLYAKPPPVLASDTPVNLSGTAGATIIDKVFNYVNAHPGTYTLLLNSDVNVGDVDIGSYGHPPRTLSQPNINLTIIGLGAERKISLITKCPLYAIVDGAATINRQ